MISNGRLLPVRVSEKQKTPAAKTAGELHFRSGSPVGKAARYVQPTNCPTEYRCYIKEDVPYATAGAVTPSWKSFPSSIGQLPVPSALNARSPTLFRDYYTRFDKKSKYLFIDKFMQYNTVGRGHAPAGKLRSLSSKLYAQSLTMPGGGRPLPCNFQKSCRVNLSGRLSVFAVLPNIQGLKWNHLNLEEDGQCIARS